MTRSKLSKEDEQAKQSKQGWRELEHSARERLRQQFEALEKHSVIDYKVSGALRNVAVTAAVAKDKAYPEDLASDKFIQIPARLLTQVEAVLIKLQRVEKQDPVKTLTYPQPTPTTGSGSASNDPA